ncbi:MAG: choice-of-anchor D domain-containing protein, partial [Ignavibacteria bacterium]|nr:choice-of-anchor D domain-containing protein [Ignavibacteria bacterium]
MKNTLLLFLLGFFSINLIAQNPPQSIETTVNNVDIQIEWTAPIDGILSELTWSGNISSSAIGLTYGGTYAIAARWESSMISQYDGAQILQFSFFPYSQNSTYTFKVWKGPNASILVYSQPINEFTSEQWNLITLNNPVVVDGNSELWIGVEISQPENEFPVGIDEGPAIVGFGDLINFQGMWENLSSFGLDFNFNIKAIKLDAQGKIVSLSDGVIENHRYYNNNSLSIIETEAVSAPALKETLEVPDSYRLYKNQQLIASTNELSFTDQGLPFGIYTYGVSAVYGENESSAIQATAQIGSPIFTISPDPYIDTLPIDQYIYRQIFLSNSGNIELNWQVQNNNYDINLTTYQGTIPAGSSQTIEVGFNTYGFIGGTYTRNISFTTNDTNYLSFTYPLQFTIVAEPLILVEQSAINFGDVVVDEINTRSLMVQNIGYGTLIINDLSVDNSAFSISNESLEVPPFQQRNLILTFSPDTIQTYNGTLSFSTNSIGSSSITVPLGGVGIVPSPKYLSAEIINNTDVSLSWATSTGNNGNWIGYCGDTYSTSVGLGSGGSFTIAARWPVGSLQAYEGQNLTKTEFYPTSALSTYILKIWSGPQASTLVHSQIINSFEINQWNEIDINNLIIIDPTQELWIGFEIIQPYDEFPATIDDGPAAYGLGDMVNIGDGWIPLSDYGLLNNWLIKGFVSDLQTRQTYELPIVNDHPISNTAAQFVSKVFEVNNISFNDSNRAIDGFLGYNIYRDGTIINSDLLQENNYLDESLDFGTYEYGVTNVYDIGESNPRTTTVQLGGPILQISPEAISDSIEAGEIGSYELTFTNTGLSDLNWSFLNLPTYFAASIDEGILLPNQSIQITLGFNPQGYLSGNYNTLLTIATNNLNDPLSEIPVSIFISSNLMIAFESDTLDLGMAPLSQQIIRSFKLINNGTLPVYIFGANSNLNNFQAYVEAYQLNPGDNTNLFVIFQGNEIGLYNATLSVLVYSQNFQTLESFEMPIKAFVSLPPPSSLTANVQNDSVFLNWYPPGFTPGLIQYGSGETMSALGYSTSGVLEAAVKFGPEELMPYDGQTLSEVEFYTWSNLSTFKIKVYTGENAETLLLEQDVNTVSEMGWNDIALSTPIPIVSNNWLWIAYEMTQSTLDFAAGIDAGPAVLNKGEMVSLSGGPWETLSYYGLPYNWNIRGILGDNQSNKTNILSLGQTISRDNSQNNEPVGDLVISSFGKNTPSQRQLTNNVLGYNVYRDGILLNNEPVQNIEYLDVIPVSGTYLYEVTALYDQGESVPATVLVGSDSTINMPEGWNFTKTSSVHNIYIPGQNNLLTSLAMSQGDMIGLFFNNNGQQVCSGAILYDNEQLLLRAYGDNPNTPEKDGFNVGDLIYWKLYTPASNQTYNLYVSYDPS